MFQMRQNLVGEREVYVKLRDDEDFKATATNYLDGKAINWLVEFIKKAKPEPQYKGFAAAYYSPLFKFSHPFGIADIASIYKIPDNLLSAPPVKPKTIAITEVEHRNLLGYKQLCIEAQGDLVKARIARDANAADVIVLKGKLAAAEKQVQELQARPCGPESILRGNWVVPDKTYCQLKADSEEVPALRKQAQRDAMAICTLRGERDNERIITQQLRSELNYAKGGSDSVHIHRKHFESLEAKAAELKKQNPPYSRLDAMNKNQFQMIEELRQCNATQAESIRKYEAKISGLRRSLAEAQGYFSAGNVAIGKTQYKELMNKSAALTECRTRIDELQQLHESQRQSIQTYQTEEKRLNDRLEHMGREYQQLYAKASESDKLVHQLRINVADWIAQVQRKSNEISSLSQQLKEAKAGPVCIKLEEYNRLNDRSIECDEVTAKLATVKSAYDKLTKRISLLRGGLKIKLADLKTPWFVDWHNWAGGVLQSREDLIQVRKHDYERLIEKSDILTLVDADLDAL